jgi:multimeric flavodoxin WrbA
MLPLHILGIAGSPRQGNSDFLLGQALTSAVEYAPERITVETYSFRAKKFEPCIGCNYCIRNAGDCVHKDDFQELKAKWLRADGIIYSLPVYHMGMPGQVKCFIDRLGNSLFGSHHVELPDGSETLSKQSKAIGTISQGIHIFSGQEHTITQIINHTLVMQSIPVAGDLWEAYIGAGGWTRNRIGRNAFEELAAEGEFSVDTALRAARSLGRRVAETADIVLHGLLAQKDFLERDPIYRYIYDRIAEKQS